VGGSRTAAFTECIYSTLNAPAPDGRAGRRSTSTNHANSNTCGNWHETIFIHFYTFCLQVFIAAGIVLAVIVNNNKNKTMKTTTTKNEAAQFGRELLGNSQDINNCLTVAEVSPTFQGHYFNLVSEKHGIAFLIAEILTEREAVFAKGIEATELKAVAVAASMFASEVISEVKARFTAGTTRYEYNTVHAYLSVLMNPESKHCLANIPRIGKIKLTNAEDKPRPCYKPRTKFYLLAD
jgi:hypothetical protein